MISSFYDGSYQEIINGILDSVDMEICATLRETIAAFSKKLARYDFKSVRFDLNSPLVQFNYEHASFFGCRAICKIFENMDPCIPKLDNEEWRALFLHGVSNTEPLLRNTTDLLTINESRVHNELRLEIIDKICQELPRYCLNKYWVSKHKDFGTIELNTITTQVYDRIWVPFCKNIMAEELDVYYVYTDPSSSEK